MDPRKVRELLERVRAGETGLDAALEELRRLPFADLGFAVVDHHRALRQGVPEVILGEGKTAEQIVAIAAELQARGERVLVTRIDAAKAEALVARFPRARYAAVARIAHVEGAPPPRRDAGPIAVVAAGTSDLPVAEEAVETLLALGFEPLRVHDVGVAGLHRLLARLPELRRAAAIVAVAGMEGALPSVIGGLVAVPVIAVPTSVGYGAAFDGVAALLGMLTSCASGITVVNIDNGFGAAMAVHRMLPGAP